MHERIRGIVINILDCDRLEIRILDDEDYSGQAINNPACIRIAGIDDPDIYPGSQNPEKLKKLKNREVQCFIMARDPEGNAVAVVHCIP